MNYKRHFYIWLVPMLFALNSLISFRFPGDEYSLWALASFPGVWVAIIDNSGDIGEFRFPVAIGGALVMTLIGWRMDRLRVQKVAWFACIALVPVVVAACLGFFDYPRKLRIADVVFGMVGVGIWFGSLLAILVAFIAKHWVKKPVQGHPPPMSRGNV